MNAIERITTYLIIAISLCFIMTQFRGCEEAEREAWRLQSEKMRDRK